MPVTVRLNCVRFCDEGVVITNGTSWLVETYGHTSLPTVHVFWSSSVGDCETLVHNLDGLDYHFVAVGLEIATANLGGPCI
jgi:hypothetical protein